MRAVGCAILVIGAIATAAPARAQAWDPNYPVCLRVYGPINYNDCRYSSLAECAGTASGRAAQCVVNPFFARVEAPSGRPYRRHRRTH
jgi:hypothetical protein